MIELPKFSKLVDITNKYMTYPYLAPSKGVDCVISTTDERYLKLSNFKTTKNNPQNGLILSLSHSSYIPSAIFFSINNPSSIISNAHITIYNNTWNIDGEPYHIASVPSETLSNQITSGRIIHVTVPLQGDSPTHCSQFYKVSIRGGRVTCDPENTQYAIGNLRQNKEKSGDHLLYRYPSNWTGVTAYGTANDIIPLLISAFEKYFTEKLEIEQQEIERADALRRCNQEKLDITTKLSKLQTKYDELARAINPKPGRKRLREEPALPPSLPPSLQLALPPALPLALPPALPPVSPTLGPELEPDVLLGGNRNMKLKYLKYKIKYLKLKI